MADKDVTTKEQTMNPDDKNRKQLQDILNGKDVMAEQSKARRVRIIAARKASETRIRKAKSQIFEANETQIHTDCIEWFKAQYRKLYDAGKLVHRHSLGIHPLGPGGTTLLWPDPRLPILVKAQREVHSFTQLLIKAYLAPGAMLSAGN